MLISPIAEMLRKLARRTARVFCHDSILLLTVCAISTLGSAAQVARPGVPYGSCPASGFTSSSESLTLKGNCNIAGDVNLSGSAALTMTRGILSIEGNVTLAGDAKLEVTDGVLGFPQTNYSQYSVTLNANSSLTFKNSQWVTNATQQNNFSMLLAANDSSVVNFDGSGLDTSSGSWLLGSFANQSRLNVLGSVNLPTEIYPSGAARISITQESSVSAVWLDFPPGSSGTVNVPALDAQGNFDFKFGPGRGIAYSVIISSSSTRLGLNSHPNSTMIVNGHGQQGTNDASVVFGYYVENSAGPVSINGLTVDGDITEQFTDQGRNLLLNHVNLGPFSWQVYVSESHNFPVSITNSKINELGVLNNGVAYLSNSVLQLAVTEAAGTGASLNIDNTQIWSQSILAEDSAQLRITNSQLHGNFISASGPGTSIVLDNVGESRNGVPPQSCAPVDGVPPNQDGVPLCNPFNPLYQCSQVTPPTGGATITATPPLTCPPD